MTTSTTFPPPVVATPTTPAFPPPPTTATPLSTLYGNLSRSDQNDLLTITHFLLVHHGSLHLTPHDLLSPIEHSLLTRSGRIYDTLRATLPTLPSMLPALRSAVEALAASGALRESCSARCGSRETIHPAARPRSVHDSRHVRYTWVRGPVGVSKRFLAGERLLKDPLLHAERLRRRGGRKDVFVSGWLASRVESAERKIGVVRAEWEREREREREREQVERIRRERLRKQVGEVVVGVRRRTAVKYVESEEESLDSQESVDTGDKDFMEEELLDGSDGSEDEQDEEEDVERDELVVGRVRVKVSERARRARRRRAEKDGDDDDDDGTQCGFRRSRRLRGIKNY